VVSAGLGLDTARGDKVDIAAIAPPVPVATVPSVTHAAAINHDDATSVSATDDAVSTVEASTHWWVYPVIGVLILGLLIALLMAGRTSTPRRLTQSEREEALLRLRQWIESTEVER